MVVDVERCKAFGCRRGDEVRRKTPVKFATPQNRGRAVDINVTLANLDHAVRQRTGGGALCAGI